jgi:hypothetical protein
MHKENWVKKFQTTTWRPMQSWNNNIKMYLKETGCKAVDQISTDSG